MNRKGVEMTLNTIVVAVLLLIVLAVVVFIFFSESNNFQKGLNSCTLPSVCKETCSGGEVPIGTDCGTVNGKAAGVCCRGINGSASQENKI